MNFESDPTSLYSVKGLVVLDLDGNRVLSKYFDKETFGSVERQKAFEKNIVSKANRNNGSGILLLLDGSTVLYRTNADLYFCVIGSSRENELILEALLNCFYDSVSIALRKNVEKKTLIGSMDIAMAIVDEIVDQGIIIETDAKLVVGRVAPMGEDTSYSQVGNSFLSSAKEQFKWSLLK